MDWPGNAMASEGVDIGNSLDRRNRRLQVIWDFKGDFVQSFSLTRMVVREVNTGSGRLSVKFVPLHGPIAPIGVVILRGF